MHAPPRWHLPNLPKVDIYDEKVSVIPVKEYTWLALLHRGALGSYSTRTSEASLQNSTFGDVSVGVSSVTDLASFRCVLSTATRVPLGWR